jgi:hypothetical protein
MNYNDFMTSYNWNLIILVILFRAGRPMTLWILSKSQDFRVNFFVSGTLRIIKALNLLGVFAKSTVSSNSIGSKVSGFTVSMLNTNDFTAQKPPL